MENIEKLSISLSGQQVAWIEEQVSSGAYGNRSEYLRDLIRRDQRRREVEALRVKLLEAKTSLGAGKGTEVTEGWADQQLARLEAALSDQTMDGR
jgi:antitoxin ParD1/3/4